MGNQDEILDNYTTETSDFKNFNFPISFEFKIGTFANDFIATDSSGITLAYVRQKMFKFKEAIMIYSDKSKSNLLYTINADRIIDFNASYYFSNPDEEVLGKVGRKGMKSLWKAHYEIFDTNNNQLYNIKEENPWSKVFDAIFNEIPILGMLTGYFFNPRYGVIDNNGKTVARLTKQKSFFGRKFLLEELDSFPKEDGECVMLALMMMMLLERRRG